MSQKFSIYPQGKLAEAVALTGLDTVEVEFADDVFKDIDVGDTLTCKVVSMTMVNVVSNPTRSKL